MRTTKAQERSAFALKFVEKLGSNNRERFAKLNAGLPAMILQNGLGQTLAFLLAKGKGEHQESFRAVIAWLVREGILREDKPEKAVTQLAQLEQRVYLRAQTEALKFLEWLKRYAKSDLFK